MRQTKVTFWAIALFVLLFGMFLSAGYYDFQTRRSQKAAEDTTAMLADVRRLQLVTSLFKSDPRKLSESYADWNDAREAFLRRLGQIEGEVPSTGEVHERLQRITETIAQAEHVREDFAVDFALLRDSPNSARIGLAGLHGSYVSFLWSADSSGGEVAMLGLALYRLSEYQRAVQQAESDLRYVERTLGEYATLRHRNMRYAVFVGFVCALVAASIMLRRIIVLHSTLERDKEGREAAEARVRASEADLRCMLDSIADAVISTDMQGRVTRMNPVACKLTGWTAEEACGQSLSAIFTAVNEATGAPMPNPAERALEEDASPVWEGNTRLSSRQGDERIVSVGAAPIRDVDGRRRGAVVVFRDITEQSRLESRIRQDQRSDSVAKLASGVAHEINNVLQIVRANLAFAQDPRTTSAESSECLGQIDHASRRAAELTRKLLIFSRKHPMRLAEGNIVRFFDALAPGLRRILGERIALDILAPESMPAVRLDQRLLELAFSNLCDNAREAMPEGGRVVVELSTISFSQEEVDAYAWARPGSFVQITVSDTGCGMDAETLKRIFEPFYTTKSLAVSTGMGLAVVQGIVQQHEGFIHAFSEAGRGSTFRIFLPTAQQEPVRRSLTTSDAPGVGRGRRILFADDDAPLRGLVAALLRRNGYIVRIAGDGDDACALAADPQSDFELVILDVVMPRMGGIEAARRIQVAHPRVPVILCTGHGRGPMSMEGALDASWRVIKKPIVPTQLLQLVAEILGSKTK